MKTQELINSKWDAIDSATSTMNAVRNDLFDNVALSLSRIEGRLKFLNDKNFEGDSHIIGDHAQEVGREIQNEVNQTRKALDDIFTQLTDGKNALFN